MRIQNGIVELDLSDLEDLAEQEWERLTPVIALDPSELDPEAVTRPHLFIGFAIDDDGEPIAVYEC